MDHLTEEAIRHVERDVERLSEVVAYKDDVAAAMAAFGAAMARAFCPDDPSTALDRLNVEIRAALKQLPADLPAGDILELCAELIAPAGTPG